MKPNVLSPRQRKFLFRLAEGLSQAQAARETGYHVVSACHLLKRPEVRAELEHLRSEAEQELLTRLSKLVRESLDVLQRALSYKNRPAEQIMAARTIVLLVERLSARSVEKPNSAAPAVVDVPVELEPTTTN
ncbi:hypothetical protein [Methylocaldum sp.]|jgi:phage terminase small subunit|uniref:hypothetical protein n=1 Tax=Methylocaldum sp. TaxID=1969727 RepID=UPI00321FB52E